MLMKPSESILLKRRLLNYLISFESVLLILLTILAVKIRNVGEDVSYDNDLLEFLLLLLFPVIWLCFLSLFGAWDLSILDNHVDGYRRLLRSSFMTFLAFSSASYLFKIQISRFVILFSLAGGTIIHLILRWSFLRITDRKLKSLSISENWLLLSSDNFIPDKVYSFSRMQNAEVKNFHVKFDETEFKGWVDEVAFHITLGKFNRVLVQDVHIFSPTQIEQLYWVVQQTGSEFLVFDGLGLAMAQSQLKYHEGFNWVSLGSAQINDSLRVVKRLFDLLVVIPSIVVLLPIYLLVALVIRIDSPGRVIYKQERLGQDGRLFTFPKFRSMRTGSDLIRLETLGRPDLSMVERYKNDPRITRVGRIIRRFSIDELPQLWCVLIGSMSLVGPRPILPEEVPQLGDFHFRRQIAKPGLTGIWQVSGRKDTSWEERMAFDVKYVQEWSLALDLILIAKTIRAIVSGKGSY